MLQNVLLGFFPLFSHLDQATVTHFINILALSCIVNEMLVFVVSFDPYFKLVFAIVA